MSDFAGISFGWNNLFGFSIFFTVKCFLIILMKFTHYFSIIINKILKKLVQVSTWTNTQTTFLKPRKFEFLRFSKQEKMIKVNFEAFYSKKLLCCWSNLCFSSELQHVKNYQNFLFLSKRLHTINPQCHVLILIFIELHYFVEN